MKLLIAFMMLLLPLNIHAATINASACTPTAVAAAIDIASPEDTVQLPSCTYTAWSSQINVTKAVHIKGTGRDTTRLRKSSGTTARFFDFNNVTEFSLCCMTLEGFQSGTEQAANDNGVRVNTGIDYRIHDMTFTHFSTALSVFGNPTVMRGVIYNNRFVQNSRYAAPSAGYGIEVRGNSTYPALELGTLQNTFIEDNYFERHRHGVASSNGSRYVVRYNTFFDHNIDATAIDAHGRNTNTYPRGSRQWEVYNNIIDNPIVRFGGIGMRGGDGTIFNNVITNLNREVVLWNEDFGTGRGCNCTPYPCEDQTNGSNGGGAYIWNNTPTTIFFKGDPNSCHRNIIQLNRDYFTSARPNYTLNNTGLPDFPSGKTSVYPLNAVYPHPLREDPPVFPPSPPTIFHVTPIP